MTNRISEPKLDKLLEDTVPPPERRRRASDPYSTATPPLIAEWKAEQAASGGWFVRWASSQVAAYRFGLVLSYLGIIYFGGNSFSWGVPLWDIAAPEGWTPVWAGAIMVGGLIAAVGATRAGQEPITRTVRAFNHIELAGAVILFLTLGTYAAVLLYYGYALGDDGRATVGSGFVALGIHPAVRMVWLIFRPRTLKKPITRTVEDAADE